MYACPDCRSALVALRCVHCGRAYPLLRGFPRLLPADARFAAADTIVDAYESIYATHANAWENQGRPPEFIRSFAQLINSFRARRVLEVGCGEGLLLEAIDADDKHATELSSRALERAGARTPATLSLALCERLPYPDASFDLVTSVGVMEHFIDDRAATREVLRVLAPDGRYVLLIHMRLSTLQSIRQKVSEYLLPQPRPVALARWIAGKLYRPIRQPVQNGYSLAQATACLESAGFEIERRIMQADAPPIPLVGPHVVIFVCRRAAAARVAPGTEALAA